MHAATHPRIFTFSAKLEPRRYINIDPHCVLALLIYTFHVSREQRHLDLTRISMKVEMVADTFRVKNQALESERDTATFPKRGLPKG